MPSSRANLIYDLFHDGVPDHVAASLELGWPPWLLLNVPVQFLTEDPPTNCPSIIDVVGGRLAPRSPAVLKTVKRRGRFHFPRPEQADTRRRLELDLALSEGLLRPDIDSTYALQLHLACVDCDPQAVADALSRVGFPHSYVLAGRNAVGKSQDDAQAVVAAHRGRGTGWKSAASRRLRGRLWRLLQTMHVPQRPPVVVDLQGGVS